MRCEEYCLFREKTGSKYSEIIESTTTAKIDLPAKRVQEVQPRH